MVTRMGGAHTSVFDKCRDVFFVTAVRRVELVTVDVDTLTSFRETARTRLHRDSADAATLRGGLCDRADRVRTITPESLFMGVPAVLAKVALTLGQVWARFLGHTLLVGLGGL